MIKYKWWKVAVSHRLLTFFWWLSHHKFLLKSFHSWSVSSSVTPVWSVFKLSSSHFTEDRFLSFSWDSCAFKSVPWISLLAQKSSPCSSGHQPDLLGSVGVKVLRNGVWNRRNRSRGVTLGIGLIYICSINQKSSGPKCFFFLASCKTRAKCWGAVKVQGQ